MVLSAQISKVFAFCNTCCLSLINQARQYRPDSFIRARLGICHKKEKLANKDGITWLEDGVKLQALLYSQAAWHIDKTGGGHYNASNYVRKRAEST